MVDLVRPTMPTGKKPKLETLRGKVEVIDPDCWNPMSDEEVELLLKGGTASRMSEAG